MSKIIKKVLLLLVLAGLLTWGVATLAKSPSVSTVSDKAVQLQGQVIEKGVEVQRQNISHAGN